MLKKSLFALGALIALTNPSLATGAAFESEARRLQSQIVSERKMEPVTETAQPCVVVSPEHAISPCALYSLTAEQCEQFEHHLLGIERPRWD